MGASVLLGLALIILSEAEAAVDACGADAGAGGGIPGTGAESISSTKRLTSAVDEDNIVVDNNVEEELVKLVVVEFVVVVWSAELAVARVFFVLAACLAFRAASLAFFSASAAALSSLEDMARRFGCGKCYIKGESFMNLL